MVNTKPRSFSLEEYHDKVIDLYVDGKKYRNRSHFIQCLIADYHGTHLPEKEEDVK